MFPECMQSLPTWLGHDSTDLLIQLPHSNQTWVQKGAREIDTGFLGQVTLLVIILLSASVKDRKQK